jgi:hypothetical protein
MKNKNYLLVALAVILTTAFLACTKNDDTTFISAKKYISPAKGKYIIYKLDSSVTRSFGSAFSTFSYTVKDSVVDVFTDNLGRESFKIFRYQLNTSNNTWTSSI